MNRESISIAYYVGGRRCETSHPYEVEIAGWELQDDMTDDDILRILDSDVQYEFESLIYPYVREQDRNKFLEWARARIKEMGEEE